MKYKLTIVAYIVLFKHIEYFILQYVYKFLS